MADILLHTLLFMPDASSNSFIISDIAQELQKHGHKVTVITTTPHYGILQEYCRRQPLTDGSGNWYKKSSFNGMECYHIVVPSVKGSITKRLTTYVRFHCHALGLAMSGNIKCDVIIAQSPPLSIGVVNAVIARIMKAKSIYIVQDLFPDGPITQGKIKNRLIVKMLRSIEKCVYKRNDAVIAISDGIKCHLESRVPSKNILRSIPNFVNTDIYHPMPKDNPMAERYGAKGKFTISYVGNIGNAHDLSPVLYCARKMKDTDMVFIIAGNGIKKDYYERKAEEDRLENIKFIGYIAREETPLINALSDICLVMLAPHVKNFSFPSKIYTLMGMAKPIILVCSPECSAAGFITRSGSGWVVESGDCEGFASLVARLYGNRELLERFGSNSLKTVEKSYTKEHVGRQYDKLVRELCR